MSAYSALTVSRIIGPEGSTLVDPERAHVVNYYAIDRTAVILEHDRDKRRRQQPFYRGLKKYRKP